MTRMIFVNLPVADLPAAKAFYEKLGFTNNPQFTNDDAACMVWSDAIFVMLLTHGHWRNFTSRPIPSGDSSEVLLALSLDNTAEVDRLTDQAATYGGTGDINPKQDLGFMYSRAFSDPDGHVWEVFWMDPAHAAGEPPATTEAS